MLTLIALCNTLLLRNLRYICYKIFHPRVIAFPSVYTKEMGAVMNILKGVVLAHQEHLLLLYLPLAKAALLS